MRSATSNARCAPSSRDCAGGCASQLVLEFATDAAIVLTATAAVLVFLDWLFRFGLPVRLVLLALCVSRAVVDVPGRPRRPALAGVAARRAVAGGDARSLPARESGSRSPTCSSFPDLLDEPGASASPAMVRLAVQQACAALAGSDWRSLWNRKRTALHAGALLARLAGPAGLRPGCAATRLG